MSRPTKFDRDIADEIYRACEERNLMNPNLWIGTLRKDAKLFIIGFIDAILETT